MYHTDMECWCLDRLFGVKERGYKWKLPVLPAQFCYEPKCALKTSLFKKKKKTWWHLKINEINGAEYVNKSNTLRIFNSKAHSSYV